MPPGGLPTGTVTFLFTDVEGSTRLLDELGAEQYAGVLAEHRRVVRSAVGERGGVEVDTQGDAFFVAFPTAPLEDSLAVDGRMVIHACLGIAAVLAAARGNRKEAATLLGASARLREELDTNVDGFERDLFEQVDRDTCTLLGEDDFRAAFEHGRSLALEGAAALALALASGR